MPANPTKDQTWDFIFWKKKVTNLNASVKTDFCSYTGLLEITMLDGTKIKEINYYKKGIGLVYKKVATTTPNEYLEYMLKTVNLK